MRTTRASGVHAALLLAAVVLSVGVAPPVAAQVRPSPPIAATASLKDPRLARALAILPGAGHLYAGERGRAGAVFGTVVGILVLGGTISDDAVECPGEEYSDEYCTSPTLDVLTYTAALGVLGWSMWDAGRAAQRTNARRLRRAGVVLQLPSTRTAGTYRVGLRVPLGG